MNETSITLTRRRLLGGVAAVGVASAGAGAGTMAYLSDADASSGNVIESGTLTLGVDGSETFSFAPTLAPTEQTAGSVELVSTGSMTGSLDVDVSYAESDGSPNSVDRSAEAVAENLEVVALTYGGQSVRDQIEADGSPPTLADLADNAHGADETTRNDLVDLSDPGAGTVFEVEFRLTNVGDAYQADGVAVDFDFRLNQHDSQ